MLRGFSAENGQQRVLRSRCLRLGLAALSLVLSSLDRQAHLRVEGLSPTFYVAYGTRRVISGTCDVISGMCDVISGSRDVIFGSRDVIFGSRDVISAARGAAE